MRSSKRLRGKERSRSRNLAGAYQAEPPRECAPQVVRGEIASGNQVVDDPSNDFFSEVLKTWPEINAMERKVLGRGSHRSGSMPGNSHKIHDDPGDLRSASRQWEE